VNFNLEGADSRESGAGVYVIWGTTGGILSDFERNWCCICQVYRGDDWRDSQGFWVLSRIQQNPQFFD